MLRPGDSESRDRLIVALDDVETLEEVRQIVQQLAGHVGYFKVGKQLFTMFGPEVIRLIIELGGRVFLDLKFHDIPNTMRGAAKAAAKHGVSFFDVHASAGTDGMQAAVEERGESAVLAVTVLTSLTNKLCKILFRRIAASQVKLLTRMARTAGVQGIICSPEEIKLVRKVFPEATIVTPGIRLVGAEKQDQARSASPYRAILDGGDYLVVGRPIVRASNRVESAAMFVYEIERALIMLARRQVSAA